MFMMTRPRRELSIAQRAKLAAEDLFGDRHAIFVEDPSRQIDKPPAHDLMDRWVRTGFDHGDKRAPLLAIEQGGTPSRHAIGQPIRPLGVEPKDPIANGLKPNASEPGRVGSRTALVNSHKSEKTPRNASCFLRKGQGAKHRPIKISAKRNRRRHIEFSSPSMNQIEAVLGNR
jgi:hypothetical protein